MFVSVSIELKWQFSRVDSRDLDRASQPVHRSHLERVGSDGLSDTLPQLRVLFWEEGIDLRTAPGGHTTEAREREAWAIAKMARDEVRSVRDKPCRGDSDEDEANEGDFGFVLGFFAREEGALLVAHCVRKPRRKILQSWSAIMSKRGSLIGVGVLT